MNQIFFFLGILLLFSSSSQGAMPLSSIYFQTCFWKVGKSLGDAEGGGTLFLCK